MIGSNSKKPSVIGIDYLDIQPILGVSFLKMNFLDKKAPETLLTILGDKPNIIVSDMAAPTTGHKGTDHLRTAHLCEAAADFAISCLKIKGHFLAKTFQGGTENRLLNLLKSNFKSVHHIKPRASRSQSVELYLLAQERK
ncbi:MAG: 23S rRNA (uridine2552-2'-O)-methyltransferase [Candidatus Tokpelaia sp. JSC161]|jgi:23S rRNA (uridine2552-2'-O)-methyltransferase|nr:MAG: 23S rRNA (uridine2552-2'-O)-methyltransferase [Candidatus Tokpelaia sp. JSC161]